MNTQIPRDALIRDLSIVLAGALHPSAETGPGRVAARRMQDVLGIPDGALPSDVEKRLREVLAPGDADGGGIEYGLLMSGGGFQTRCDDPEIEKIYPTAKWAAHQIKSGGHVYRRRIVILQDWEEISAKEARLIPGEDGKR